MALEQTIDKPVKAYNIAVIDDDTAEINMYGEVVSKYPVDWWTGEKIPGNFIALDEFLQDLKEIEDKANIIIHINSVGGDFYAGLSIYNRLKGLPGNITTINDGGIGCVHYFSGGGYKENERRQQLDDARRVWLAVRLLQHRAVESHHQAVYCP